MWGGFSPSWGSHRACTSLRGPTTRERTRNPATRKTECGPGPAGPGPHSVSPAFSHAAPPIQCQPATGALVRTAGTTPARNSSISAVSSSGNTLATYWSGRIHHHGPVLADAALLKDVAVLQGAEDLSMSVNWNLPILGLNQQQARQRRRTQCATDDESVWCRTVRAKARLRPSEPSPAGAGAPGATSSAKTYPPAAVRKGS